jgi:hypothetical protein
MKTLTPSSVVFLHLCTSSSSFSVVFLHLYPSLSSSSLSSRREFVEIILKALLGVALPVVEAPVAVVECRGTWHVPMVCQLLCIACPAVALDVSQGHRPGCGREGLVRDGVEQARTKEALHSCLARLLAADPALGHHGRRSRSSSKARLALRCGAAQGRRVLRVRVIAGIFFFDNKHLA